MTSIPKPKGATNPIGMAQRCSARPTPCHPQKYPMSPISGRWIATTSATYVLFPPAGPPRRPVPVTRDALHAPALPARGTYTRPAVRGPPGVAAALARRPSGGRITPGHTRWRRRLRPAATLESRLRSVQYETVRVGPCRPLRTYPNRLDFGYPVGKNFPARGADP
jgi:hypothetical protein